MATPKWPRDHEAKHRAAAKLGWQRRKAGSRNTEPTRYFAALEAAPTRARAHSPKRHVATRKVRARKPAHKHHVTAGRTARSQMAIVRGKRRGTWRGIDSVLGDLRR